eukprot:6188189-Pleurochrysis_carterae.AAC.2
MSTDMPVSTKLCLRAKACACARPSVCLPVYQMVCVRGFLMVCGRKFTTVRLRVFLVACVHGLLTVRACAHFMEAAVRAHSAISTLPRPCDSGMRRTTPVRESFRSISKGCGEAE